MTANYKLSTMNHKDPTQSWQSKVGEFTQFLSGEKLSLAISVLAVLINIGSSVATPWLIAYSIDNYIVKKDFGGLSTLIAALVAIYLVSFAAAYLQSRVMGHLSQRTLYRLRGSLFDKIQSLPILFFNQNRTGDLISRINNDTDKLNQFLSEAFLRFISIFLSVIGIAAITLYLNWELSLVMMSSSVVVLAISYFFGEYIQNLSKKSLAALGSFSAQVEENLTNYKVLVAFHQQDYFREKLQEANQDNFKKAVIAQIATGLFTPLYNLAGNLAQMLVLLAGIYMVSQNRISIGLLIGFLSYTQKFYDPLRILGSIWGSLQETLGAWSRIQEILSVKNNLEVLKQDKI